MVNVSNCHYSECYEAFRVCSRGLEAAVGCVDQYEACKSHDNWLALGIMGAALFVGVCLFRWLNSQYA